MADVGSDKKLLPGKLKQARVALIRHLRIEHEITQLKDYLRDCPECIRLKTQLFAMEDPESPQWAYRKKWRPHGV